MLKLVLQIPILRRSLPAPFFLAVLLHLVQLTYHTDYALRILIYLISRPGHKATTREMAEFYGISLNHLTKVAKGLTRAGWLKAARGIGGGLTLAEHTPNAKVGEIVRLTETWNLVECFEPVTTTCPIVGGCRLKPMLHRARAAFFDVLDSQSVRDLAMSSLGSPVTP
jgi:Rrf2 family nitric oxide-sensitive transcriptional repressor